jgi:uncharacterized membrane protein
MATSASIDSPRMGLPPGEAIRDRPGGREGWTGTGEGRALASLLGLFSVALGTLELVAPRNVSRALGLKPSAATTGVIQAMGLRELASGAGILSNPGSKEWIGSRVGGDVVDLALLGVGLMRSQRPVRTLLAAAAVAGVAALDLVATEKLSEARKSPVRRGSHDAGSPVVRSITIDCPRSEVYGLWRRFENLPRFMEGIEAVESLGDGGRSRWRARGPLGTHVEWESELVADEPNSLLSWRSTEHSSVYHSGTVRFADAPRAQGTVVTVEMRYAPPGGTIAAALLKVFRKEPGQQVGDDLRRLKQVIETGEVLKAREGS